MRQLFKKSRSRVRADGFEAVCRVLSSDAGVFEQNLLDEVDPFWIEFTNIAMDQHVAPALAYHLQRQGLNDQLPRLISRNLDAMLRLNRSRNQRLQIEALEVAEALNEIDVLPIFVKGSAGLLTELYEDPGYRIMGDLDILVPLDSAEQCGYHLKGLGYRAAPMIRHPRNKSVDTFTRQSSVAPIDLHHQVLDFEYRQILSTRDVVEDCVEHKLRRAKFAVPSATHQMMINIAHAQLNDHGYWFGNLPLRAFLDVAFLNKRDQDQIDWRFIENTFAETNNRRAMEFHLHAAQRLLTVDTRSNVKPRLLTRLLYWRAVSLMGYPTLQRVSFRLIRIILLFSRELSSSELRSRLRRNMTDPAWWQRHMAIFRKGTR